MDFRPGDLEPAVREYLAAVGRSAGRGFRGVYVPLGRRGAWVGAACGVVLLSAAGALSHPLAAFPGREAVQAVLAAIGTASLLFALRRLLGRWSRGHLGNFVFADALHVWEVRPGHVRAVPISDAVSATGPHNFFRGRYTGTDVTVTLPAGDWSRRLHDRRGAERLMDFVNALATVRHDPSGVVPDPQTAGAIAERLAAGRTDLAVGPADLGPPLPTPSPDTAGAPPGRLPILAAAALTGAAVWWGVGPINERLRDDHLYAAATAPDAGIADLDAYLAELPAGLRADEIAADRDDRLFALGRAGGPGRLREYLADGRNTRHRAEARRALDDLYRRAAARLRTAVAGDAPLRDALLRLLDAARTADGPEFTVGFRSGFEAYPSAERRAAEDSNQRLLARSEPTLRRMIAESPNRSAVLAPAGVFSKQQMRRREAMFLQRLADAIERTLGPDLLTPAPAQPGATPDLEITYTIRATGDLWMWTQTAAGEPETPDGPPTKVRLVRGLVRRYRYQFEVEVGRRDGAARAVRSIPATKAEAAEYEGDPSDPEWAPYVVLGYAAFREAADRLTADLGLAPPAAAGAPTFAEAVGGPEDEPSDIDEWRRPGFRPPPFVPPARR